MLRSEEGETPICWRPQLLSPAAGKRARSDGIAGPEPATYL